jgi:hypothetical protein
LGADDANSASVNAVRYQEHTARGILKTVQEAKDAGSDTWQSQAILRGCELLSRGLGMFHDKLDVNVDDEIINRLMAGRRNAGGTAGRERGDRARDLMRGVLLRGAAQLIKHISRFPAGKIS